VLKRQRCAACSEAGLLNAKLDRLQSRLEDGTSRILPCQRTAACSHGQLGRSIPRAYYIGLQNLLFRIHGLDPASKPPSGQEYLDRVHPHDRESLADLIKGILGRTLRPSRPRSASFGPNGELRYNSPLSVAAVSKNQSLEKVRWQRHGRYGARAPDSGTPTARSLLGGSTEAEPHRELGLEPCHPGEPGYWSGSAIACWGFDPRATAGYSKQFFSGSNQTKRGPRSGNRSTEAIRGQGRFRTRDEFCSPHQESRTSGPRAMRSSTHAAIYVK